MDYRHELKFLVSDVELEMIRYRLKVFMQMDRHQKGTYRVRSLYFDDLYDSCMKENEDGVDNRKKFRIRIYDGNDAVIKLEKKMKFRRMTQKVSMEITKQDCLTYMSGRPAELRGDSSSTEKEMYVEMNVNYMHPVSIVEYERTAFVEPRGSVRITFDRNISGCSKTEAFFLTKLPSVPLLPKGQHILEVKYDEFLPSYLTRVLEIGVLQETSFSKYYYSRNAICVS